MNAPIPDLNKCIHVCTNHSWSSFIYRRSEYKGFYESLQIAFPNNVLVSQFHGWILLFSIDIPRCLIIDCFYGPRYVSHPPFLERSANLWCIDCVSTTSYTLVYLLNIHWLLWWMRDGWRVNITGVVKQDLHISMVCSSLHGREGRSQQSSLGFKETWTKSACWRQSWFWQGKNLFFTLPLRIFNQML